MAASTSDIRRLRRMTAEPTNATYNEETMAAYLEAWPLIDSQGRSSTEAEWTEAYDLHAAAAEIWEEKAAAVAHKHDFSADGANYSSSQMFDNFMERARYHQARQKALVRTVAKRPVESSESPLFLHIHANIDPPGEDDLTDFNEIWNW